MHRQAPTKFHDSRTLVPPRLIPRILKIQTASPSQSWSLSRSQDVVLNPPAGHPLPF